MPDWSREFQNRTATVMGLGSFGGGLGVVRFLCERGARVIVTDLRPAAELADSLRQLDPAWPVTLRLGEHVEEDFLKTDLVVVSPAVPKDSPFPEIAREEGIAVTCEMNLFWERNRGRVVAVTGSNGKSTTTAMIHSILVATLAKSVGDARTPPSGDGGYGESQFSRAWLGGNIGISLLPMVEQIAPDDIVVLELSSFQLEDLAPLRPKPVIAVITNFSANHLDRHGTVEAYRAAKQVLLRSQTAEDFAVVNAASEVAHWPTAATRLRFGAADEGTLGVFGSSNPKRQRGRALHDAPISGNSESFGALALADASGYLSAVTVRLPADRGGEMQLPLGDWLRLPGSHNWQNAQAAIAASLAAGASVDAVRSGLSSFKALPHRLQLVGEVNGRQCVNDSKSTTPEATVLALQSFDEPIVLLAGGYDKQIDLSPMASAAVSRCRAVALLGQAGPQLGRLIEQAARVANVVGPTCRCFESLEPAVAWSLQVSESGDVVLISPGCASYDWFQNYIERGERFAALVNTEDSRKDAKTQREKSETQE